MMTGVGVAHKLLKKQEEDNKKKRYKSLTKPPHLKLFTSSPQGQAYQAMSLPNPRNYLLDLKLIFRVVKVNIVFIIYITILYSGTIKNEKYQTFVL